MRSRLLPVLSLAFALAPAPAAAWESRCYQHPDESLEPASYGSGSAVACSPDAGPNVTHHRWIGPLDEHRQLWELGRIAAGLPDSLSRNITLRVFASARGVRAVDRVLPSYAPVPFAQTERVVARTFTIGELAQLPDYSYSLWDWANGNESCPLTGGAPDAIDCHAFATHMGPVNANHFVPLAQAFYARGHQLALARASECRDLATRVASAGDRFRDVVLACEEEALAIEAASQHYLQDGWSAGHMWQRWGSPDLSDVPGSTPEERRARAVLIALASGLIHGARGVLQSLPEWTTYDVNDALCAPNDHVRFAIEGRLEHGVGDGYLDDLVRAPGGGADAAYRFQHDRLLACETAGMLAVYGATARVHGELRADAPFAHPGVDPTSSACWSQRATNDAMLAGAGVQYRLLGIQDFIAMDARFVSWALPTVGTTSGHGEIDPWLRNLYRLELSHAVSLLRIFARSSPDGTEAADGAMGDVLGIHPNGAYLNRPLLASYVDPELPWPSTRDALTPDAAQRAAILARVFRIAHAADWCAAETMTDLEALRAHAQAQTPDPGTRAAACDACVERVSLRLRVGSAQQWNTRDEPFCAIEMPGSPTLYAEGRDRDDAAHAWCGCRR